MDCPAELTPNQVYHNAWKQLFTFPGRVWQIVKVREDSERVLLLDTTDGRDAWDIYPDGTMKESK